MKAQVVFGIDVGGTTVKCGLFTRRKGNCWIPGRSPRATENQGSRILPDVAESVQAKIRERALQPDQILGLGIGVPGPVNQKGEISGAVNLHWGFKDVAGEMREMLGMKVRAGNDANVAALGEMWAGGGKGASSLVMVTLGTGVGGGVIVDGKIVARRSRSRRGDRTRGYGAGRDRALQLRKPGLSGADGVCHRTGPSGPAVSGKVRKGYFAAEGKAFRQGSV